MEKIRKSLIGLSLILFVFFVYQGVIIATTNISNLYKILELKQVLFWVQIGIYGFILAFLLVLISGFMKRGLTWYLAILGYFGVFYLLKDIFDHVFNANKVFECSINYSSECISYLQKFETIDFNLLNINYYLLVFFGLLILVNSILLLLNRNIKKGDEYV